MKSTKSKHSTTTKTSTTKAAPAVKGKKTLQARKPTEITPDICTCDNCLAQTQARRLNTDFKNAVFIVSLGVNLILFTLIITAMVSDAYAQQLGTFF